MIKNNRNFSKKKLKQQYDDYSEDDDIEIQAREKMNDPNTVKICFFCNHRSESLNDNIGHMQEQHGFTIPLKEFITDLEGLIKYLSVKIFIANVCIHCNNSDITGRNFRSYLAAQSHMRDSSHCSFEIVYENELEYDKFYDFVTYKNIYQSPTYKINEYELLLPH